MEKVKKRMLEIADKLNLSEKRKQEIRDLFIEEKT